MPVSQKKRLNAALALSPKHVKRQKKNPIQPPLFGFEQPVSADDIALWCTVVAPRISPERRTAYVKNYNVASKIIAAKNSGKWPPSPLPMQYG